LPLPDDLEGTSLVPLLDDPKRVVKRAAFSQYPRPQQTTGYTIRTEQHRYTEWRTEGGDVMGVELYDHQTDPQENINLAGRAASRRVVDQLSAQLRAGWRAARVIP
jgi:iduronate 2-sulfatase